MHPGQNDRLRSPVRPRSGSALRPRSLLYSVRGLGTLWQVERPIAPAAVADLLGATRAGLLLRLAVPASSTELAARLDVSVPAVNQHLRALQAGGLLTSSRYGRAVLYRRSALGDALLGDPSVLRRGPGLHTLGG